MNRIVFFAAVALLLTANGYPQNYWQQTNGPFGGSFFSMAINSNDHIFVGTWGAVYRSKDNGINFSKLNISLTDKWIESLAINLNGHIFAGAFTGGILRSNDNGDNWIQIGLTTSKILSLAINSSGHIFAGTLYGVYRSTNSGSNWAQIGLINGNVLLLSVSPNDNIYAWAETGFFRSTDNGNNWIHLNNGFSSVPKSMAINSNEHIFMGTLNGVYRSTDNGNNWLSILSLPDIRANSLKINTDGHIFAATNGNGVYLSTDNGDSWKQINDGLETGYTLSLAINSGGYIFTGTKGGGVYKSINSTTSLENEEKLPISFALYQNYPNPFGRDIHSHHPSTAIKYTITNPNRVLLTIYNVLGKEVARLVNEEKPAGSYEVSFNAEGLAGGIYFYRLQAGNHTETKKLVVLK